MKEKAKKANKGSIVLEVIKRFPRHSNKALSKYLMKHYSHLFTSESAALDLVRYYRGSHGKNSRKYICNRSIGLPESKSIDFTPYVIDNGVVLIMADIHIPYHDNVAIETALKHDKSYDTILLNGDIADHYALSRFNKVPTESFFVDEIRAVKQFFEYLRKNIRFKGRIIWKLGNHEERLKTYLMIKAPEFFDCEFFEVSEIFDTDKYGIEVIEDKRIVQIGKLNVIHGHEFGNNSYSPVNTARALFMRGIDNAFQNHTHRISSSPEVTMTRKFISCWSGGCLCDLHPLYARINKWMHGFAIVEVFKDDFHVSNYKILHNRVYLA